MLLHCLPAWGVLRVSQAQSSSAGTEDEIGSPRAALTQARVACRFTSQLGKQAGSWPAGERNGCAYCRALLLSQLCFLNTHGDVRG